MKSIYSSTSALALLCSVSNGVTIESAPLPSFTFAQTLEAVETRTGSMGFSSETYEVVYPEGTEDVNKTLATAMCKRITTYKFFKIGDDDPITAETPYETEVSHEDFLPLVTCCSWGLKPYEDPNDDYEEDADTIALRDGACPAEMQVAETLVFDPAGDQCLKVTTNEKWGEFDSHVSVVVDHDDCCTKGKNPDISAVPLVEAQVLVQACEVTTVYSCVDTTDLDSCKKTDTTYDANGNNSQTDTQDDTFVPTTDESKEILCKYYINQALNLSDRENLCEDPKETVLENVWDQAQTFCFDSTETEYYDGRPDNVQFAITPLGKGSSNGDKCCNAEQSDACEEKWEYTKDTDTCEYGTVVGTTPHADGSHACCEEGWRTDRDDLKQACNVDEDTYEYTAGANDNADAGTCTLHQLEISPTVNSYEKIPTTLEACCNAYQEQYEADSPLLGACDHILLPLEQLQTDADVTYDAAKDACTLDKPQGSLVFWTTNNAENYHGAAGNCAYVPVTESFIVGIAGPNDEVCPDSYYICEDIIPITHKTA